jgi:hypothetical protein
MAGMVKTPQGFTIRQSPVWVALIVPWIGFVYLFHVTPSVNGNRLSGGYLLLMLIWPPVFVALMAGNRLSVAGDVLTHRTVWAWTRSWRRDQIVAFGITRSSRISEHLHMITTHGEQIEFTLTSNRRLLDHEPIDDWLAQLNDWLSGSSSLPAGHADSQSWHGALGPPDAGP